MWCEQFKDRYGKTKYRYYEKFKDPYTDKWKRVSIVLNKNSKASQKEAMLQLDEKIKRKVATIQPDKCKKDITFSKLMDEWLEFYANTSGTKYTWHVKLKHFINRVNKELNNDILARNVDRKLIQDVLIKMVHEYDFSVTYCKKVYFVIKSSLKFAKENYYINNTAFLDNIVIPKKVDSHEYIERKRYNYLERDELSKVLNTIDEIIKADKRSISRRNKQIIRYQLELQALTGMRIGEVQALQNRDFDEVNRTLSINGSIQWYKNKNGYGIKDTTKTENSYRTIDLDDRSIKILKLIQLENRKLSLWSKDFNNRQFIFSNSHGNPLHNNAHSKLLKRVKNIVFGENANRQLTTHTFRHTHISLLTELGLPLKVIMERVGHVDERTTLRIYTHVTSTLKKDLITKLNNVSF
ncbi:tyrosine-type recombinase/integrase [Staphylococcus equorum]|uniref:tyrosine-type recombinase/integrase n=1 Tax=Staphylococcus equorum TaxID=246432 RepID=UPI000D1C3C41|nr:site-specific integrase [Staphylococcus equorum]PTE43401.1 site-specific integrase [Staphylococcus equorum]RIL46371.1 site-specific integrase [Staphylococcus equorum]